MSNITAARDEVAELKKAIEAITFDKKEASFKELNTNLGNAQKEFAEDEDKLEDLKEQYDQKVYDLVFEPAADTANDANSGSDEVVEQEEGGAVLGANREQPTIETAVEETVQEEGSAVLGADRSRGRSPKTGDASNALGAVDTMGSSLVGTGAVLGLRRRNKR